MYFYIKIPIVRYFIPFILAVWPAMAWAQRGPCKKITRKTDMLTGTTTLRSPDLKTLTIVKQVKDSVNYFSVLIHFADEYPHFDKQGASVTFRDGTTITDESAKVMCTQELSMVASGSMSAGMNNGGRYMLQSTMRIADEYAGKFMLEPITRVGLHNVLRPVSPKEAEKAMNYIRCLK